MITLTVLKNGNVVSSYTIPGPGFHTWMFDGYTVQAQSQYQAYLQQPYSTTYTVPSAGGDALTSAAVDRMSKTITDLLDVVLAELQKERDFWRSRAQALETENALLRSDG